MNLPPIHLLLVKLGYTLQTMFPYLLSGAVRPLFGDSGDAAFTGRRSRCWGHDDDNDTKTGAWISCWDGGVSKSEWSTNTPWTPLSVIQKKRVCTVPKWKRWKDASSQHLPGGHTTLGTANGNQVLLCLGRRAKSTERLLPRCND